MRLVLLLAVVLSGGCQTAEIAVDHSLTGIHVAAKFEAKDAAKDTLAQSQVAQSRQWNGGDQLTTQWR
jgi:hypothetical protein